MKPPLLPFIGITLFILSIGNSTEKSTILSGFSVESISPANLDEIKFSDSNQPFKTGLYNETNFKNSLLPSISVKSEKKASFIEIEGVRAVGLRDPKSVVSDANGELFVLDSHPDGGRIYHLVNGADYGWRRGTAKKPEYFEDVLPAVLFFDTNQNLLLSGAKTNYPKTYQQALFSTSNNTIQVIYLIEQGSSYVGKSETLYTSDQPITKATIHSDGLLYFETSLGLFKVTRNQQEPANPEFQVSSDMATARLLRENITSFQNKVDGSAIEIAWPSLASNDRTLRQAARLAIESQPISSWRNKALAEEDPQTIISTAIALVRSNETEDPASLQKSLVDKLATLDISKLSEPQQLGLLRAYSLAFSNLAKPSPIQKARLIATVDPLLPTSSEAVNLELLKFLVYLRASTAIDKGIALIESPESSESAKQSYALLLSYLERGWTMAQRQSYFNYLNYSKLKHTPYHEIMYVQALAGCSDEEREALSALTGESYDPTPTFSVSSPEGPGRQWTLEQALAVGHDNKEANLENGRSLYFSIGCASCHRLNGLGGGIGPDLSAIPHKFGMAHVVESILDPNKEITEPYNSAIVKLKNGSSAIGIVVERGDEFKIYSANSYKKPKIVTRDKVEAIEPVDVSQMPTGLLSLLNEDELRDLLTYLMAGGKTHSE